MIPDNELLDTSDKTAGLSRRAMLAMAAALPMAVGLVEWLPAAPRAQAVTPGGTSFVAVAPARLADTRPATLVNGFIQLDANTIRVQVAGLHGVALGAEAAVLNVTAVNRSGPGYVTVYPAGMARPEASNVNIDPSSTVVANLVTVRLGTGGAVDIFAQTPTDVIVDVSGAYVTTTTAVSAGRFVALQAAARVLDTRSTGSAVAGGATRRVDLAAVVPATASAVVVNLTATESAGAGFWTAFAAGATQPASSNVNTDGPGQTKANQAIVPIGVVGSVRGIDVFSSSGGHLVVDVAGYFTGAADPASEVGLFVPSAPTRVLDTRQVARYGRMYAGWVAEFDFTGRNVAQAVVVNITATDTRGAGFFTGYPARTTRPLASNLNATGTRQTLAGHAILRSSTIGVALYTQTGAALVVDVAGFFTGVPVVGSQPEPVNVVPAGSPLPWALSVPRIGVNATVVEDFPAAVLTGGAVGHQPGSGLPGEDSGQIVLFGNRVSGAAVFANLHLIGPGDTLTVTGADGRVFTYLYERRVIVASTAEAVRAETVKTAPPSLSLIANSRPDFEPRDPDHYLLVIFTVVE